MFGLLLAFGAALGWGTSDFLGGLKSRAVPLLHVLLVSQAAALVVIVAMVAVRGDAPPGTSSLVLAGVAGVSEVVAIAALYRGLAVGTMSIVAPCAAVAPAVPLLAGLAFGEIPTLVQAAGLVLAIVGIVITSLPPGRAPGATAQDPGATAQDPGATALDPGAAAQAPPSDSPAAARPGRSVAYGLLAALGFGTFFFAMGRAGQTDVPWALLAARAASVSLLVVAAAWRRTLPTSLSRADLAVIATIGLLIVAADSMYATAATFGLIGVVAVVGSLHTVVTLILARVFLAERLARIQQAGVAIALLGVLTISAA